MSKRKDIDGGYAWVVLAAAFGMHIIFGMFAFNTGLVTKGILQYVDEDLFRASWVGSAQLAVMLIGGPIAGLFHRKAGPRITAFAAGCLSLAGLVVASYMTTVVGLLCTYSLITGFGMALGSNVLLSVPVHYFQKKLSFVFAILMSGSGFGLFLGSFLITYLLDEYLFSGTMLILGGVAFHFCIAGTLFRKLERQESTIVIHQATDEDNVKTISGATSEAYSQSINQQTRATEKPQTVEKKVSLIVRSLRLLTQKTFLAFNSGSFFWGVGESISFLHLPNYVMNEGGTPWEASSVVSVKGVAVIISTLLAGFAGSDPAIGYYLLFSGMIGLAGTFVLLLPLMSHSYPLLCLFATLFGLQIGGPNSFISLITLDLLGPHHVEVGVGIVFMFMGVGYLIGPPIASLVFEFTAHYELTFVLAGLCLLLSSICIAVIPSLKVKQCSQTQSAEDPHSVGVTYSTNLTNSTNPTDLTSSSLSQRWDTRL